MSKSLIDQMKEKIAKSGSSKKEILYWGKDTTKRIRFLNELDAGFVFQFHNNWDPSIFELCKDPENHENCKLCEEGIALQDQYVWSVWDYDSNSVRIIQFKATGVSPIPALIEMYDEFGTILDRDYKIKKVGMGQGSSFVVTPLDKERFKNPKAKPFTYKQVLEILENAWKPKDTSDIDDESDDEEDEVKEAPKKKAKKEKTIRSKYEELTFKQLKEIAMEIGMSRKELRNFEDEDELIDELFDNYEETDLEDLLEDLDEDEDDE